MTVQNNLLTVQLAQILTAITAGHLCKKEKKKKKKKGRLLSRLFTINIHQSSPDISVMFNTIFCQYWGFFWYCSFGFS